MITLLSDMGTRDTTVAMTRAVLMQHVPAEPVVDITHNVVQYDVQQAAYLLLSSYRFFPAGAYHIVMVDVFTGGKPRILIAEKEGHYFIAADNGILPLAFEQDLSNVYLWAELTKPYSFKDWIKAAAAAINEITKTGASSLAPYKIENAPRVLQPRKMADGVECNVLYIDRYENIVLDLTKKQFEELVKNRPFRITIMRMQDVTAISNNYSDVRKGEPLCRFNNAGFLELAINHDKAATLLGLGAYNSGNLRYQTVKILFQ